MKYKKSMIFIFLVICFLSIAGVCASDTGDVNIQAGNDTADHVIASEEIDIQDGGDAIASDEANGHDTMAVSDENDILTAPHSFDELQDLVDNTDEYGELNLTNDYSLAYGGTTLIINKPITIDGNGHTLDGGNLNRIVKISVDLGDVTFKNIKFKNGGEENLISGIKNNEGGAIFNNGFTALYIINCDFRHNEAYEYGGAIYSWGPLEIYDSHFQKNIVRFGNGGAIFCNGTVLINNTDFIGNEVQENINPGYKDFEKEHIINILNDRYYFLGEHLLDVGLLDEFWRVLTTVFQHTISQNPLPITGGAICCKQDCTVINSNFQSNIAGANYEQIGTSGGAIHCLGNLMVNNSHFDENAANDWGGGAIFAEGNCTVYNSIFDDNTANKGCAIYCWGETYVYNSEFSHNRHDEGTTWMESWGGLKKLIEMFDETHITEIFNLPIPIVNFFPSEGGAIWSQGKCYIESCEFDGNYASEHGGAIYAKSDLNVAGENVFHNNNCYDINLLELRVTVYQKDGGAIYCKGNLNLANSLLYNNAALTAGGAIYCENEANIANSSFTTNIAYNNGGAIFTNAKLTTVNCNFTENALKVDANGGAIYVHKNDLVATNCKFTRNTASIDGGAIFCEGQSTITDSTFESNRVNGDGTHKNYGGAIRSKKSITVTNCNFTDNTAEHYAGAIYADTEIRVTGSRFEKNVAKIDGGAIYCEGITTVSNSTFSTNKASGEKAARSFGGAIRSDKLITVTWCVFENNFAYNQGGAIYADDEIRMVDFNNFTGNSAKEGGAVHASILQQEVSGFSVFVNNHATDGSGGAIYVYHHCDPSFIRCTFSQNTCTDKGGAIHLDGYTGTLKVSYSKFDGNSAGQYGGAIYTNYLVDEHTKTDISNSHFTDNTAKEGGAVYTSEIIQVSNSEFLRNKATSGNGGGVYVNNKCNPKFSSCIFGDNSCTGHGGAIYLDGYGDYLTLSYSTFNGNQAGGNGGATYANYVAGSTYSKTEINNCTFTSNSANMGGAVFTCEIPKTVSKSTFVGNKATGGDGGAVYINNKCNPEFVSCRFEQNNAYDTGGAIYLDSFESHLKVSYCTFVGNHADKKKYSGAKRHAAGHSIFNKGYYDFLDLCWLGKNDINKDDLDQQFVECKAGADDKDHAPHNTYKIGIKLNETDIYERNNYEATIYFYGGDLNNELLHSTGRFYGDGNFSNVDAAGPNDMTADVNFIKETHTIYGKLDNQVVSLTIFTRVKSPNIVEIISCVGKSYPNGVSVKFESLYGVPEEGAIYVIKDMQENVVRQGKINPIYREFTEKALLPGNYSVTVIVPEQRHYLEGSATATFEIAKGDCYGEIILNDVTYPSRVDMYISAMLNVNWNFTITGDLGTVTSRIIRITEDDVVPYDDDPDASMRHYGYPIYLGTMDPGEYEVTLTHEEDNIYKHYLTFSVFRVHSNGTAFEIEANPHVITLGENATVTHVLPENATGKIKYYFKNGTFLGEASVSENFTLHILNAGSHIIVGNYSGDSTHVPQSDLTYILVKKAKPEFQVGTDTIRYGKRATVTHELPLGAEGTIKYYLLNGTFLGELPANESFVLPVWNVGSYVIVADYSGDGNFLDATANTTLTILDSIETQLTTSPVFTVYKDNDYLLIKLEDVNNKPIADAIVTVDLNGNKNYTTDADGQIEISTSNLGAGTYDVYVTFDGMGEYRNCSTVTQVFINSRPSIMTVTPLTTIYQVHKYLMVNLKDDTGRPISGVEVFTVIHGVTYKATTDSNGNGRLIIRLDPMDYVATVILDNENYTISFEQSRVLVYKADPKIIAKSKKFKANKKVKKYTITLRDNIGKAIKNAKVTLKIKGKIYVAKTNSQGKATFKIKKLTKKGNYKATVTFEGNFYFNKVTKKVKITCSK